MVRSVFRVPGNVLKWLGGTTLEVLRALQGRGPTENLP